MDVSRRNFLVGAAGVVVGAAIPAAPAPAQVRLGRPAVTITGQGTLSGTVSANGTCYIYFDDPNWAPGKDMPPLEACRATRHLPDLFAVPNRVFVGRVG